MNKTLPVSFNISSSLESIVKGPVTNDLGDVFVAEIPTSGDQDLEIESGDLFFGPAPPSPD